MIPVEKIENRKMLQLLDEAERLIHAIDGIDNSIVGSLKDESEKGVSLRDQMEKDLRDVFLTLTMISIGYSLPVNDRYELLNYDELRSFLGNTEPDGLQRWNEG